MSYFNDGVDGLELLLCGTKYVLFTVTIFLG